MAWKETRARIEGGFWRTYQDLVRERVIPYQWKAMKDEIPGAPKSHSVENFRIAAGVARGTHEGMVFQDSDLAKWLEAAGYVLADGATGATDLQAWVEEAIDLIARAQQPDGYVNTYFTLKAPDRKFRNLQEAHELYCAGHLIEAGVSVHRGTGNARILEVVRRLADLIDARFGIEPGKTRGYDGHEEVELALVKLYRLTGERRYLLRARYFVDERGRAPSFFEKEAAQPDFTPIWGTRPLDYFQAHLPVREQADAVGHAVRAMYLYIAMADVALETGDASLAAACDRLWESTTERRMYVTGSIGSSAHHESFSTDYDLPNDTAYAETCAAIGLFLFGARMARLHDDARYVDVMERALYNGIISGLALNGESYFYVNPLEVVPAVCDTNGAYRQVKYRRQPWYGCACCPPNIARTIASLGEHVYRQSGDVLSVDLYHEGSLAFTVADRNMTIRQRTRYPWDGTVLLEIDTADPVELEIALRIPSWCRAPSVRLNGGPSGGAVDRRGYHRIRRTWQRGDRVELELPMAPERISAHPRVRADYGKVALQRGPLVYCLEEADNGPHLHTVSLPRGSRLDVVERPDMLGGVTVISAKGRAWAEDGRMPLYPAAAPSPGAREKDLFFIPYYAWANRSPGEMLVWVRESEA
jgi:DUF1680 family protein